MPIVAPPGSALPVGTPTDSTSPDGHLRAVVDDVYGGVLLIVDYTLPDTALGPLSSPFTCQVYRETPDGTVSLVRGGDPYRNYGGKGRLYDQEGPLATACTYWAVPLLADGTMGAPSAGVQVVTSTPYPGMWLTSPYLPSAAILAYSASSRDGTYPGRSDLQTILGSAFPAVTLETSGALTQTMSLYTFTQEQAVAAKKLFDLKVIFRKATSWEQPDGWFVIQDVTRAAAVSFKGQSCLLWTLQLTEIDRPSTAGQFVSIPGNSFKDRLARFAKFSDVIPRQFCTNLLLENDSEFETSVAWTAGSNTTTPVQDFANFRKGAASMKFTAVAAGTCAALSPYNMPVVPGGSYEFGSWCFSPVGRNIALEIDWKDASNTYLGFVQSPAQFLPALQWTYVRLPVTAIANATAATAITIGTATHAGDAFNFDVVSFADKP